MLPKQKIITTQKKKNNIGRFLYDWLLVCFLGVIIYVLFFSSYLTVNNILVSGEQNVPETEIVREINADISGKYLKAINKDNILVLSTSKLEKDLESKFKIIKIVSVDRKFPSSLVVEIQERALAANFCSGSQCFIVDDAGQAFEEINPDSADFPNSQLVTVQDLSGVNATIGETVLDPALLKFINSVSDRLKNDLDIETSGDWQTPNRVSYDLRINAADGWEIFFNANIDPDKEIGMLKTVLTDKIPNNQRADLEYIDLRADNKVFYKFKDGTQQATDSSNQTNNSNINSDSGNSGNDKKIDKRKKG